jgi:hypothetical protein
MSSGSKSCPDDGTEVVGILDAIEQHDKSHLASGLIRSRQDILEPRGSTRGGNGHDPLMIASVRHAIQLAAIFKTHADAPLACQLHDLFDAGILSAFGNEDAVKNASSLERFANSMNAGESIHGEEVYS